jgi:hypothetical protein
MSENNPKLEVTDEEIEAVSGIDEDTADLYAAAMMYNGGTVEKALIQINKLQAPQGGVEQLNIMLKSLLCALITDETFNYNKFKNVKLKELHKTMFDLLKAKAIISADIRKRVRSGDTAEPISQEEKESILKRI